ncbi:MAG: glycosyltransferase family 4 protein [Candidatus Jordarchaeum sp.]|uniref:glycosyltransferase family 4 protein n=1 Tax=Candidatus Jordarchaeum sp. TaxID=2823881 RepID=UPI00404A0CA7
MSLTSTIRIMDGKSKMKILQITYIYPPESNITDGITYVAYNISKELSRRGHEVTVYTSNILNLYDNRIRSNIHNTIIDDVNVHYFRSLVGHKTFFVTPTMINSLKKNINKFDIIHLHDARGFQGIITYLFAKAKKIPYVFQSHGAFFHPLPILNIDKIARLTLDKIASERIVKNASKIIALSQMESKRFQRWGIPKDKIFISPNAIDLSMYEKLPSKGSFRKNYKINNDEKIILYLGRINKFKGIELLIESFAILAKKLNNVKLVLAGPDDGFLNEALLLTKRLKLESKVLFTGYVSEENKLEAFIDADVFVTPLFYGFPITFLEACIAGVPIVTTKLGDILSWINDRVGFACSPTPADLSKAIYKILSSYETHEKFSRNCKDIVHKEFSIEKVVSKLEDLYQSITH